LGAVDHLGPHQTDYATTLGVHRDDRVHEHADIFAVAHSAEADLAAGMGGEVELRSVGYRQHAPSGRAPGGQLPGVGQHFVPADRLVVEEGDEPERLGTLLGQHRQAHGPLLLHRVQQIIAGGGQTPVAEPAELGLLHGNRSRPWWWKRANPGSEESSRAAGLPQLQHPTRRPAKPSVRTRRTCFADPRPP
jgi:hypothetical protein